MIFGCCGLRCDDAAIALPLGFWPVIILPAALASLRRLHRMAEADVVARLRPQQPRSAAIEATALRLAQQVRTTPPGALSAESFLRHYGLSTPEGVALMCVAEALLRIPDAETADALLREKLAQGNWATSSDDSLVASAADWALLLTGKLARWHDEPSALKHMVARLGEPVVRAAVRHAMRILAEQFVLAETIEDAARRGAQRRPYLHSYDMLGEAARTARDAQHYMDLYTHAIGTVRAPDTISIKLSALHPRFEEAKRARVFAELLSRLRTLAHLATERGITFTIDAEESERLELTLDLHAALAEEFTPGLAVQAYQKRALPVCEWLVALGRKVGRRLPIRLVKGAYWDSEIKRAQQLGMPDYPVFTRKAATDLSYVACATTLLGAPDAIYAAFATHNCRTVATILELAARQDFEFQKLVGMGDALYDALLAERKLTVRMYAPVGSFTDLLPYLVRRMLENGANTSFVHQIADPDVPLNALVADPLAHLPDPYVPDPRIPLPRSLYPDRLNSIGLDLARRDVLDEISRRTVGDDGLGPLPESDLESAITRAARAFDTWSRTPARTRAQHLESAAD